MLEFSVFLSLIGLQKLALDVHSQMAVLEQQLRHYICLYLRETGFEVSLALNFTELSPRPFVLLPKNLLSLLLQTTSCTTVSGQHKWVIELFWKPTLHYMNQLLLHFLLTSQISSIIFIRSSIVFIRSSTLFSIQSSIGSCIDFSTSFTSSSIVSILASIFRPFLCFLRSFFRPFSCFFHPLFRQFLKA